MKKSLILELHVPLSGDMFEDAEKISTLKHATDGIKESAERAFGENNYTLTTRTKSSVPGRGKKKAEGASDPAAEQAETAPPPHLDMAAK